VGEDKWLIRFKTPNSAKDWVHQIKAAAGKIAEKKFWGILVSVPGLVDEAKGRVIYSPNLHWTEKTDFSALIQKVWRSPVILVQEGRALALGHHAVHPTVADFFMVDFGEGVGGSFMIGGRLYNHPLPIGGELGHTPVMGNQRKCGCGATGCLETLASTRGLLKSFAETSGKTAPSLEAIAATIEKEGVPPWLAETFQATAGVIAGALNVLGLRRVVITGAPVELPPPVFANLAEAINQSALWARFGDVKVEAAPRRRMAGLVAAGIDRLIVPMKESS